MLHYNYSATFRKNQVCNALTENLQINFESIEATIAQKLQKSNLGYKKVRTCRGEKYPYNSKYRGQKPAEYLYGGLKNGTF